MDALNQAALPPSSLAGRCFAALPLLSYCTAVRACLRPADARRSHIGFSRLFSGGQRCLYPTRGQRSSSSSEKRFTFSCEWRSEYRPEGRSAQIQLSAAVVSIFSSKRMSSKRTNLKRGCTAAKTPPTDGCFSSFDSSVIHSLDSVLVFVPSWLDFRGHLILHHLSRQSSSPWA